MMASSLSLLVVPIAAYCLGLSREYWYLIGGPYLFNIAFAKYHLTYLPHHGGRGQKHIHDNTRDCDSPTWVRFLILNQNLHVFHHREPAVPWWAYRREPNARAATDKVETCAPREYVA